MNGASQNVILADEFKTPQNVLMYLAVSRKVSCRKDEGAEREEKDQGEV